ncbi:ORF6N domain-containing protein [Edwardsiella tarda]|uniref:ORF6N domain-containing protein n=1 Tax=Edwardsiella tarda TaxID=636 RepID=UPI00351C101A
MKKINALNGQGFAHPAASKSDINIQLKQLPAVEFYEQRVVTFAMIDEAHQRTKGTARDAFNRHRRRFIDEIDTYLVDYSKKNVLAPFGIRVPPRGLRVFTESGYLLLTKPFDDDLSWLVQRELVNVYFRRPEFVTFHHVDLPSLEELIAMPVTDAQNAVTRADKRSKQLHGSQGSNGMNLRKKELKVLRPAERLVDAMGQIDFDKYDWEAAHDRA